MLLTPLSTSKVEFRNRVVMAPMTRSRAEQGNIPGPLMVEYYQQRASAGLIITEGTSPSPNGLGYPRIPGLFNEAQMQGWKKVTEAVHARGGKIFVQLMHTGRVSHSHNLPAGAEVLGPMSGICPGEMFTDSDGLLPHSSARAMTENDINQAVAEHVQSAQLAIEAGFDGVELHAANGYLIEQFLNANVNQRTDAYGGSIIARNHFALRIAKETAAAIGGNRVGIRLSPYGALNSTGGYPEVDAQYLALINELSVLQLLYVHVLDHSAMGAPAVPATFKNQLRQSFNGIFILAGGFDRTKAEAVLANGETDLVAFGRPFISNPDLVERMQNEGPLNSPDMSRLYTPGPQGYTDYPSLRD